MKLGSWIVAIGAALFGLVLTGCSGGNQGLQVIDLQEGVGQAAKTGDTVEVFYTGWLPTGKKFDSNKDSGHPLPVCLGSKQVIEGWEQGLIGMKKGGKRKLLIPPELGYGSRGSGTAIPPNAELIFEVELVRILEPGSTPPAVAGKDDAKKDKQETKKPSKLKIEDLKEGAGPAAKANDTVTVHYTGWLTDGTKFDSSLDGNEPFRVKLGAGRVIKGWDKGLVGMKVGGKRKLHIPPEMAYGPAGRPPVIPPAAELIFEIEMLKIEK